MRPGGQSVGSAQSSSPHSITATRGRSCTTTWDRPALRVQDAPPLDVTAIDNLPSMLPVESSQDYAAQLLPSLLTLGDLEAGVWGRAKAEFDRHISEV